jgi:hypothetical protein
MEEGDLDANSTAYCLPADIIEQFNLEAYGTVEPCIWASYIIPRPFL